MVEHLVYTEGVSGSSPLLSIQIYFFIIFLYICQNGEIGIHAGFRFRSVKGKGSSPFTGIIFL